VGQGHTNWLGIALAAALNTSVSAWGGDVSETRANGGQAVTIYAMDWMATIWIGGISAFFVVVCSYGVIHNIVVGDAGGIFWACAVLLPALYFCLSMVKNRKPYLRIDGEGIESARGRVRWSDVERVVALEDGTGDLAVDSFVFVLPAGTRPMPVAKSYLDGGSRRFVGRASMTSLGLEMSVPGPACRKRILEAVSKFDGRPIEHTDRMTLVTELQRGS
jgi:hypothetical protein